MSQSDGAAELKSKQAIQLVSVAMAACSTFGAAWADYSLPQPAEDYMVVPDSWALLRDKPDGPVTRLECDFQGTKHTWAIEKFWLADRLDSNTICTGKWRELTESYLTAEEKLSQSNKAAVEVIALKKGGPIEVVGIWNFGNPPKYEKFYCAWAMPKEARDAANKQYSKQAFDKIGQR